MGEGLRKGIHNEVDFGGGNTEMWRKSKRVHAAMNHPYTVAAQIFFQLTFADYRKYRWVDVYGDDEPRSLDLTNYV